jgi:hypothetical protein
VDPRPGQVGHQSRRVAQGQLDQPVRHLGGVDRLEPEPGRHRDHRQPGQLPGRQQGQGVELGRPQRRPGEAGAGHDPLGGQLGREVAEHRPVQAAGHRDPVGPDDRDEHQVPRPGPGRRRHQVARLDLVAPAGAGAVHDDPGPPRGGVDPLAGGQVAGRELDPVLVLVAAPAEHQDPPPGVPQPRHDQPAQGARAAGDQHGLHGASPRHIARGSGVIAMTTGRAKM